MFIEFWRKQKISLRIDDSLTEQDVKSQIKKDFHSFLFEGNNIIWEKEEVIEEDYSTDTVNFISDYHKSITTIPAGFSID